MNVARILGITTAALLSIFASIGQARAQMYQGRELVKAQLLADTSAIVPGKPLTTGVLLRMAPGWHTYWKFSGDAGLSSEIKWKLPPGWKAGEIQWPTPLKLQEPGDIQTYGYSDEVLLMQEITPPSSLDDSAVKIAADANWLVCEKLCIPGSATLQIELPRSTSSNPANTALFDRYRKLLPQRWTGQAAAVSGSGSEISLALKNAEFAKQPHVDFYPLPDEKSVVGHPKVERRGDGEIAIKVPFDSALPKRISGVIVAGRSTTDENRVGWFLAADTEIKSARAAGSDRGVLAFLFLGFVGGFILNLMPCVLPVISLKLFGFVQQAGQDRHKILRSGLAFVAGIFAWFIGLALLLIALKAAGHQITWAVQFTNPYFVLFLSVIVLVFALNLFGVFEIAVPQGMMRLAGSTATQGDASSFFQGVFATVLATPCTAPFLGTALGFAFTQSALIILSMFVAIAAGMSAPYLLLCAQPAWLRFLPKPGIWMEHVKQFMGFLLLATLIFLLYVLGAQRGTDALIWASCFLLFVSIACWIKGRFMTPVASRTARVMSILSMSILLAGSGIYFIGGKFRSADNPTNAPQLSGDWQPFTPDRLQSEIDQGHSVFIDFTAAWCITCKFNEKSVLESATVREAFQRHGVVKLKADWTNGDPAITKLLQQFGRPGVPLYVLYPGQAAEPIVFPEVLTKGMVLDKLKTITRAVASQP
jgi:thiol:disulfide interchange protein DsbD